MAKDHETRLGKLPPQYTFVLNPYAEYRFARCPNCDGKTRQRKLPLFIHVDPGRPVALNYTCRYCPRCDLLIAHQDQVETFLARVFAHYAPSIIGNDYLVIGTLERSAWRKSMQQPKSIPEMLEYLHDFKEVQSVRVQPGGWYPADMDPSELPVQEPSPLDTPWRKQAPTGTATDQGGTGRKPRKRRRP